VARLLGQHGQDHKAQVALVEEASAARATSAPAKESVAPGVFVTMLAPSVMVMVVMSKSVSQCMSLSDTS
jgi:hypothetical protein